MMFWTGLLVGLAVGAVFGFLVTFCLSLLVVSTGTVEVENQDEEEEPPPAIRPHQR